MRDLLQSLKSNLPVWYAPDQRYTGKNSEIVPFFGQPAASNVATSRLAKISGAPVLPYFPKRRADNRGYVIQIHAPLDNFPSDDPVADTRRFHELIEVQRARSSGAVPLDVQALQAAGTGRRPVPRMSRSIPRYWPTWLALGILRVFEPLPFPLLVWLGRRIGELIVRLPLAFVRIARRNLELCLPELAAAERETILREHFRSLGVGIFETAISWWSSDERIRKLTRLEGEEHLQRRAGARPRRDSAQRALHDAGNRRARTVRASARRASCIARRATSCSNAS